MNAFARRTYLSGLLNDNNGQFFFNGNPVCHQFLCRTFGFSRDMQGSLKGTTYARKLKTLSGLVRDSVASKRDAIICFLERLADSTADQIPEKEEQHLLYFQKLKVYEIFVEVHRKLHRGDPPSESYFYIIWAKHV